MDARWLQVQFELHPDKSKAGLAKAMGLEPPAVSKILGGKRQIKAHEYMLMRKYFGLPAESEKPAGKQQNAFVLDALSGSLEDSPDQTESDQWIVPADIFRSRTAATADQIKVFKVQENAMAPEFTLGEYVVVDLSDKKPSPPGVFVISDGFGYLVRRCAFQPSSKPPKVRISALDKNFETQTLELNAFKVVGRVIAKLQWL